MAIQNQYVSTIREAQQNWADVVETFTDSLQKFAPTASPFSTVDPNAAIDQLFDFWEKTLEVQRDVAKQFAGATISIGEKVRDQAETVGTVVRDQVESAQRTVREQAEEAEEAAREEAARVERATRAQAAKAERAARERIAEKYEDMTKAELQEVLASRDLPKTGNVEELRDRLIADDQE